MEQSPEWCYAQTEAAKVRMLYNARVYLCTIASTSHLLRECGALFDNEVQLHTVIVDESGCTPESSTAMLLRLKPHNLILTGTTSSSRL